MNYLKSAVSDNIDALYQDAINNIQQGNFANAKTLAKKILKTSAGNAGANYLLGVIAAQNAKYELACKHFKLAIKSNNQNAMYFYNFGVVSGLRGLTEQATKAYEQAIKLNPELTDAHNNLGILFFTGGQPDKALSAYDRVLQLQPDKAITHGNRGNALKELGKADEAVRAYQRAIELQPNNAEPYYNLGILFESMGRSNDALNAYEEAVKNNPELTEAFCNHGVILVDLGRPGDAEKSYHRALKLKPDYTKAHSNLLFSLNYRTDLTQAHIYNAHCDWERKHGRKKTISLPARDKTSKHRLRIAYVSPDFRNHSVAFFFKPLLSEHNREKFEIYCYSNTDRHDAVTEQIKSETDHWLSIVDMPDKEVVKQIQKDKIDILVDLAGHTAGNRLPVFTYKAAPVQISWLGYPNTTGLQTMDYRLTDNIADPVGQTDALYSEKLIRLKCGFLCYQAADSAPAVAAAPCLSTGHITFGSFNVMAKINNVVIAIWSEILHKLPESHLLLKNNGLGDDKNKQRILNLFAEHGIDRERVDLYGRLAKQKDHLALYRKIDISLDTFPYNGTTTSCEALWMGIPVITLSGEQHASRVGASILTQLDYREWIASTTTSYIETAVKLADDKQALSELRHSLRKRMMKSTLLDAKTFTTTIENTYRKLWQKH